jgi:ariadne-1
VCVFFFAFCSLGPWSDHGQNSGGFYKCNKFLPAEVQSVVSAIDKAKAELDRYLHYYQRYHNHDSALKFAARQRVAAERKMVEQQEHAKSSWIDVQFLKQAAEQVIDCRRVLKYTYVLGYSLKDASQEKQLFEYHQEMLEKNTERLQEYTEMPIDAIERSEVRRKWLFN